MNKEKIDKLTKRIYKLELTRHKLNETECRNNTAQAFKRKQERIADTTQKIDKFWTQRARLLRAAQDSGKLIIKHIG